MLVVFVEIISDNKKCDWLLYLHHFLCVAAEKLLESTETQRNYAVLLLNLIDKAEVDMTIRVAGSIAFKNYIKRNWAINEVSSMDK